MTVTPIRRALIVDAGPETAFRVFTDDLGSWWPLAGFSVHGEGGTVAFVDGTIVERSGSGEEVPWGSVTAWEPPHRVAFTWHPSTAADAVVSQVDVRFTALEGQTLVVLEHSGWDAFGDPTAAREAYSNGWPEVLAAYAEQVEGDVVTVVLRHHPGPAADLSVPLYAQPGFADHMAFVTRLQQAGRLLGAGPLPGTPGDGMTVLRLPVGAGGLAEATRLAREDDASVVSGFLTVDVEPWSVMARS